MTLQPGRWYPNTKATREQMDPEQYHWLRYRNGWQSKHTYLLREHRFDKNSNHDFDVAAVAVARERV